MDEQTVTENVYQLAFVDLFFQLVDLTLNIFMGSLTSIWTCFFNILFGG